MKWHLQLPNMCQLHMGGMKNFQRLNTKARTCQCRRACSPLLRPHRWHYTYQQRMGVGLDTVINVKIRSDSSSSEHVMQRCQSTSI